MARASFGLILANRAVVLGAIQARDLIELSQQAEASGAFDALWVGDSLLAKPRLEAVALLSALAGATSRLKLAVGCLATFVHRHPLLFAQQWASLDVLSGGRAWLAVCLGGPDEQSAAQALEESKAFLDTYYTSKFSPAFVEGWTVAGSPAQCIAELREYAAAGLGHIALRLTSWDQRGQLKRFLAEVAPALAGGR